MTAQRMTGLELVLDGHRRAWPPARDSMIAADGGASAAVVRAGESADGVLAALAGRTGVVVVTVAPVTDTLKVVDARSVVRGTADREHHRLVGLPLAAPLAALLAASDAEDGPGLLARLAEGLDVVPLAQ